MPLAPWSMTDYPRPMIETSPAPEAALEETTTLGISPGDPRLLPFPQNLAVCVLITLIDDLKSGEKKRRNEARYCVEHGWIDIWVDHLALPEDATQRVLQLLDDLAAGRPQY